MDKLRAHEPHNDAQEDDIAAGETLSYGLSTPDGQPSQQPEEQAEPSGVKFCKKCMKTQPSQGTFCVYCGSHELTLIQTVQQESYLGQLVAQKFQIIRFIDRGGMGEVYLGINEALGQKVAIKFLHKKFASDESLVMRFLNEARSYCRVHHPNAVTLLEYGQHDDGALYIITEFIEGQSLTKTLKARGPMEADKVISIGKQICEVLSAAHREGVIHRDLKPDNIMLIPGPRDRYQVKVLDFGIAKIKDDEGSNLTETGAIFGTPEFMSPEQARGDGAEPRSDLYALGLILFYTLTGKLPFSGKNKFAILHKHIHDAPPRPSERAPHRDISPELEAVILRCMAKDPEDRFIDADALYDALEAARTNAGIPSHTIAPGAAAWPSTPPHMQTSSAPSLGQASGEEDVHHRVTTPAQAHAQTPSPAANPLDHELSLDDEDSAPIELADTISPDERHLELASIDLARERPEDLDDLEDDEELGLPESTPKRALLVLTLLAALIGGGWLYTSLTKANTPEVADKAPIEGQAAPAQDPQQQKLEQQASAALGSSRDALDEGKLDEAAKHLEATHQLLRDEQLSETQRQLRAELEKRLTALQALEQQTQHAAKAHDCQALLTLANTAQPQSQGLAATWRERAFECQRAAPNTKPKQNTSAPPKTEPKTAPKPEPKPEVKPEVKPQPQTEPKAEQPPKIEPKIEPQPKPDPKPEPKTDPEEPGMALPPKQL